MTAFCLMTAANYLPMRSGARCRGLYGPHIGCFQWPLPKLALFEPVETKLGGLSFNIFRKVCAMARRCELTGKAVLTGNNVSHAKNRSRRRFLPNLCDVSLTSETLGQQIKLRVSAAALRTVEHRGGLDAFLAKAKDEELSSEALRVKKLIAKKQLAAA